MAPHAISFSRATMAAPPVVPPPDPPFSGNTVFIAPAASGGADANSGSEGSPRLTIGGAAALMNPGDRCLCRGGQYLWSATQGGFTGGSSWGATKLFQPYPGEAPIFRPTHTQQFVMDLTGAATQFIEFSGIAPGGQAGDRNMTFSWQSAPGTNAGSVIKVQHTGTPGTTSAKFIRFRNLNLLYGAAGGRADADGQGLLVIDGSEGCEILGNYIAHNGINDLQHGLYIQARDTLVEGNDCDDNWGYGIQIFGGNTTGTILRRNLVRNNSKSGTRGGIVLGSGTGILCYNCLVYDNARGVDILGSCVDAAVYFLTLFSNSSDAVNIAAGANNTQVFNSIFRLNGGNLVNAGTGTDSGNNLNSATDPQFVDPTGFNFHLLSGSPARGGGTAIAGIGTDYDGVTRGNPPDIGAYQYV